MRLIVSNLPQTLTEQDLQKMFSEFGAVEESFIKRDKKTKVSFGFGHIDMPDESAKKAIEALNGKDFEGKTISVLDQEQVQKESKEKNFEKNSTNSQKIHGSKNTSGFGGGSTVRRSGGGGRGK
jgi:cold-inducible RNA-binding protein